jgi:hypothetical protein
MPDNLDVHPTSLAHWNPTALPSFCLASSQPLYLPPHAHPLLYLNNHTLAVEGSSTTREINSTPQLVEDFQLVTLETVNLYITFSTSHHRTPR